MAMHYCPVCTEQTPHHNVSRSAEIAQVTRATIYHWLHKGWIHYLIRPSGRKLICERSLSRWENGIGANHQSMALPNIVGSAGIVREHLSVSSSFKGR